METKWFCIFLAIVALSIALGMSVSNYCKTEQTKAAFEHGYVQQQTSTGTLIWIKDEGEKK